MATYRWEKVLTNPISERGLISTIYTELKKLDFKNPCYPIEKTGAELNREFSTEKYQMAEKFLKKSSTSMIIRENKIKTTLRFHLTPIIMAKIKNSVDNRCW